MSDKFYLTTSIAYVNSFPHLGYALETVQADVIARSARLSGKDVFFLTGTDEHGKKVIAAAEESGQTPEDFTDKVSFKFRELTKILNLSNDDFIRTSDKKKHWPAVQEVWRKLERNGDIYKKKYKGFYCSGCEAFITKKDLFEGRCAVHKKEPEVIEEENYFFRLSRYSEKIEKAVEKGQIEIMPESRKKEMLNFAGQGLEDISFSRPSEDLKWGIPVPGDPSQTIYVWGDALVNYISALGYPNSPQFKKYWPADLHCIGKDIQKFHCLIWPGMLLSLGIELPKAVFIHGFITVGGQKMSKSLGNIIDPFELVEKYGADPVRYFLLSEIPPTQDGDFTVEKFEKRYNSDLAKGLGNLTARIVTLAKDSEISNFKKIPVEKFKKRAEESLEDFRFSEALAALWELMGWCDRYIEKEKPWETKDPEVLGSLLFALREIALTLRAFLPETAEKILEQIEKRESRPLFPRI